jgi:hypothetical protein
MSFSQAKHDEVLGLSIECIYKLPSFRDCLRPKTYYLLNCSIITDYVVLFEARSGISEISTLTPDFKRRFAPRIQTVYEGIQPGLLPTGVTFSRIPDEAIYIPDQLVLAPLPFNVIECGPTMGQKGIDCIGLLICPLCCAAIQVGVRRA